jgi:RES domain-containing protein
VPISGVVFRVTSPRYRDLHSTALITQQPFALGRFNTAECGAVYVAREPETACEELRRRLQRAGETLEHVHPRSIFVLDIHLHAVADIRTRENLIAWGLTANDVAADDMKRCQNMARTAAQLGYEAVRWRSATGSGESLALYIDQLRPGSRTQVAQEFPLTHEMLNELQRNRPITALVPELSHYTLLP